MNELKQEVEKVIETIERLKLGQGLMGDYAEKTINLLSGGSDCKIGWNEQILPFLILNRQLDFEEKYFSCETVEEEKTIQERMREKLRCAECGGRFKKDDVVIEKAIGLGCKDFYHEECFSKKGKKDENKEGFDHLKTAHRAIDNLKIEVGSLEKENKRLQDMIIGSVESNNTCTICNKPIFGKMLSTDDGLEHPECYWEDRFNKQVHENGILQGNYINLQNRFVKQNQKFGELKLKLKELSE